MKISVKNLSFMSNFFFCLTFSLTSSKYVFVMYAIIKKKKCIKQFSNIKFCFKTNVHFNKSVQIISANTD